MDEKLKIYVASSWRNEQQPAVVEALREAGFEVYDFRNPEPGDNGFHWSEIDPDWKGWDAREFASKVQSHPVAKSGFDKDMNALMSCDLCVLVMPSGRSAHLEAGYAVGAGIATCILLTNSEPELMYRMANELVFSVEEVVSWCQSQASLMAHGLA
jgi:hypothetical protein